ncbi:MFS general substrate transporter [Basidiobolus meristosporus CBS 931.73]|uniref:MFS general substrate transporter n=1 Tax=Basidiobolus meristosporus CBS 931.73 TaxID=1314790 RepID=A0A1Y1YIS0_9FUNG|nr:MFS general substrate transporter [Basidiobolus meristosporus CBS 931.73]|eukprot:ORX97937.1 MFS general substrate transporter [Basidiobolus meristosporus CBS 931.73]
MYYFSSADRSNVGVALTMNKEQGHDLLSTAGLTAQQSALGVAIFYIGYTVFEIPSNLIMTKVSPSKWLARICITWGAVAGLMALISNAASFFALRFLLGVAEAGLWPGMALYLTKFYRKKEIGGRVGTYYFASSASGIIGNFISAGVQLMDGINGIYGWKWLLIINGTLTVIVGIVVYFMLPDNPESCRFLSEKEKELAMTRMKSEVQGPAHVGFKEVLKQMKNYRVYIFGVLYMCPVLISTSLQYYVPTIIAQLGGGKFSSIQVSLMIIPYGICMMTTAIIFPRLADRFNSRSLPMCVFFAITGIGFCILSFAGPLGVRYFGVLVAALGQGPLVPIAMGWTTSSANGEKAVAATTGIASTMAQLGVIFVTYLLYQGWPSDAPRYVGSNMVNVGLSGLGILVTIFLRWDLGRLNRIIERDGQTKDGVKIKYLM